MYNLDQIYLNIDIDTLAKVTILKELALAIQSTSNSIRENIRQRLITSLYYYRTNVKSIILILL